MTTNMTATTDEVESVPCPNCGIRFIMLKEIARAWRESHKTFYCPNGHSLSWGGETPSEKELKDLRVEVKTLHEKVKSLQATIDTQKATIEELKTELEIWSPASKE